MCRANEIIAVKKKSQIIGEQKEEIGEKEDPSIESHRQEVIKTQIDAYKTQKMIYYYY
jgi:hypothetical protein